MGAPLKRNWGNRQRLAEAPSEQGDADAALKSCELSGVWIHAGIFNSK